jgi:hypothetical protein
MRGNLNLHEASETYHPKILFKLPTALKEIDDDLIFVRMLKKCCIQKCATICLSYCYVTSTDFRNLHDYIILLLLLPSLSLYIDVF